MSEEAAVLILLFVCGFISWGHGYSYGKRTMLELLRNHIMSGMDGKHAVWYEERVLDGEKPFPYPGDDNL